MQYRALPAAQVVILGDTIVSAPIAPLAHGCDIISHEATFMRGEHHHRVPCKCKTKRWLLRPLAPEAGALLLGRLFACAVYS